MRYIPVKKISVTIPPELLRRVEAFADLRYASRSEVIRRALLEYLERHGEPVNVESAYKSEPTNSDQVPQEAEDLSDIMAEHPLVSPNDTELLRFLRDYEAGELDEV